MHVRYIVKVDVGTGDFSNAHDISAFIMSISFFNGFQKPLEPVAADSWARIVVNNELGLFSPERETALSGLEQGRKVGIWEYYNGTLYPLFIGYFDFMEPEPGRWGPRTARINCTSFFSLAQRAEAFVAMQLNKRAEQVIEAIVQASGILPPGFTPFWLLGITGLMELGVSAILGDASYYMDADTGRSTFGVIGDKWKSGVSVLAALRETVGREFGWLFLDRNGRLVFWNRRHKITKTDVDWYFDNTMHRLKYEYSRDVFNHITVRAHTRKLNNAPQVVAIYNQELEIAPGAETSLTFRYVEQSTGAAFAAINAKAPLGGTDFNAYDGSGGSGNLINTNIATAISQEGSTGCTVSFTNNGPVTAFIQSGVQLRATGITDYGQVDVVAMDEDSLTSKRLYSKYRYPYEMETQGEAENIAGYLLNMQKTARGRAPWLEVKGLADDGYMTAITQLGVGSRIKVLEAQTGLDREHFILSEEHTIVPWVKHDVRFGLEEAGQFQGWQLGITNYMELGQNAVLMPL